MRFTYTKTLYEYYVKPDLGDWVEEPVAANGLSAPRSISRRPIGSSFPDSDDVNLLRIAIRHEVGVPWRCASGNCGTDRVLIEEGAEHLSTLRRRERERLGELLGQGYRLCCQTYATGDAPSKSGIRPARARRGLGGRRA